MIEASPLLRSHLMHRIVPRHLQIKNSREHSPTRKKSAEMTCIKWGRLLRLCATVPNLLPGPTNPWAYHLPARRSSCHMAPPRRLRGLTWLCHASAPHPRHVGATVGPRGAATWPCVPCRIRAGLRPRHVSSAGPVEK